MRQKLTLIWNLALVIKMTASYCIQSCILSSLCVSEEFFDWQETVMRSSPPAGTVRDACKENMTLFSWGSITQQRVLENGHRAHKDPRWSKPPNRLGFKTATSYLSKSISKRSAVQFHHFDQVSDAPGLRSSPVSIVPAWYFADRKCCAGRKPPWEGNVKNSRTSQVNELDLIFFNGCLIAGLKFKSIEMNKYWHIPHVTLHSEFNHLHIKSYLPRPSIALEASLMPVSLRTNWSCQRFCTGKMRGMRTWRSCAQHRTIQIPCHGLVSSNCLGLLSESQYSVLLHYSYGFDAY